jgi:ELWxxDGT repeat protein
LAALWKSNGTAAGTTLVKDINPNNGSPTPSSDPLYLTNVNGQLFFQATNGVSGKELWTSNGTAAGTALVLDISPGSTGSYLNYLVNANGTLFFRATDGTHGAEPWILSGVPLASRARAGLSGLRASADASAPGTADGDGFQGASTANPGNTSTGGPTLAPDASMVSDVGVADSTTPTGAVHRARAGGKHASVVDALEWDDGILAGAFLHLAGKR